MLPRFTIIKLPDTKSSLSEKATLAVFVLTSIEDTLPIRIMFFIKLVYPIKNIIIYICFVVYYNIYLPMLLYSDKC